MLFDDRARAERARWRGIGSLLSLPIAATAVLSLASATPPVPGASLTPAPTTRVADPKLAGGGVEVSYYLYPPGAMQRVVVEVLNGGGALVRQVSNSVQTGTVAPLEAFWDGLDVNGDYVDTGDYSVRVRFAAGGTTPLVYPVSIVRLGITEIESKGTTPTGLDSQGDEFQMVYFKKNSSIAYYVTPAIHEYFCTAEPGELSDLDLNDGSPRPAPAAHADTAQPVMSGVNYEAESYNYPLCYIGGSVPRFELTFGATSTSVSGTQQGVGYPIAGVQIAVGISSPDGKWDAVQDLVAPGGTAEFVGEALPRGVTRSERTLTYIYRYSQDGGATWTRIPGSAQTQHRFYTVLDTPNFAPGDSGQQYAGPWVEVADYVANWAQALNVDTSKAAGVVEAGIQGFFGQQGSITTSIEGVIYDCYPAGGDGGANHYFLNSQWRIQLGKLLDHHANGVYVNCSDCAGSTSAMIAMLGVDNVQQVHLGPMTLKAIWGIGTGAYTTNLWGGGSHSFSYHEIITRDAGVHVSDACMCLDEDGSPNTTPGIPGYNNDRDWAGQPFGYDYLSSYNTVTKTIQALPKIQ